jgi:hypothetical protein
MIKEHRYTLSLMALFFISLMALWGLQFSGVLTEKERRQRESRLLPNLQSVPEGDIAKVTIERGNERLAFERRPDARGRWQMVEPLDVAAEPTRLETLVRTLKGLRRSPDSGTLGGDLAVYGLEAPAATVRLFGGSSVSSAAASGPIATLEVGKAIRGTRYVRPEHQEGVDTVDAKLLAAIDLPPAEWRGPVVMGVATFEVVGFSIKRPGQTISGERDRRGRWKLTAPVKTPAIPAKVESMLAALSALRVVKGADGYVADNVKDFAPYGLAPPAATVELATTRPGDEKRVLEIGKAVPGHADRVYVRQADQDDVVAVEAKALAELPPDAIALRSKQVVDIEPAVATRIEIASQETTFTMEKGAANWELTLPRKERADNSSIQSFLSQLDGLETSEFLKPNQIRNTGLSPPRLTIKVWEKGSAEPTAQLHVGQHDFLRKAVYAQLPGDHVVLALPVTFADVLPKNSFAFRNRTILSENPAAIQKLVISHAGQTVELEPGKSGEPNQWRMRRPVDARADAPTVTRALAVLTALRAVEFVTDSAGDGKIFGLDQPTREISWVSDRAHLLKVGARVPKTSTPQTDDRFAVLEGQPLVFVLGADVLAYFDAEFHEHLVDSFPITSAERMILRWPNRTVVLHRRSESTDRLAWIDEPGSDTAGLDLSRADAVATALSRLETLRFFQYEGSIPASTGILKPRLIVEVDLGPKEPNRVLRIGYSNADHTVFAATGTSDSGPVFFLPAVAWDALIASGERFVPLPDIVFAPGG